MHCPRPIGRISTHSSGYHEERTGDSTTYLASKAGQSRQVALNLGSHRSENTGWGWCWPRLIDKVLTRHVDPGQMVRQLLTMAATVAVTSLPRGVQAHVEQGWLSDEAVRVRPSLIAELGSRRCSVGYSVRPAGLGASLPRRWRVLSPDRGRCRRPADFPADAGVAPCHDSNSAPPASEGRALPRH